MSDLQSSVAAAQSATPNPNVEVDETPPPFDIHEAIARAVEQSEAEQQPSDDDASDDVPGEVSDLDEDGPGDEPGELPESEEVDDVEEDGTDPEGDDPESEEPEAEEGTSLEQDQPPSDLDPRDEKIAKLEALAFESQKQAAALVQILQQQAQAKPAPKPQAQPQLDPEVARLAIFGGDEKDWEKVPQDQRLKATQFARKYVERETRYALDPQARYTEQLQKQVVDDVYRLLEPVIQDFHNRKAKGAVEAHAEGLTDDPADKQRLEVLFRKQPGHDSPNWQVQETAFKHAAQELKLEKRERAIAEREKQVTSRARQNGSVKAASRKRGRGPSAKPTSNPRPTKKPGQDLLEYHQELKEWAQTSGNKL